MPKREEITTKVAILTQAFRENQMSDREASEGAQPSQPPTHEIPRNPLYPPKGPPPQLRPAPLPLLESQHEDTTADVLPVKPAGKVQQPKAGRVPIAKVKPRAPRRDDLVDVASPLITQPPIQGLDQTGLTETIPNFQQGGLDDQVPPVTTVPPVDANAIAPYQIVPYQGRPAQVTDAEDLAREADVKRRREAAYARGHGFKEPPGKGRYQPPAAPMQEHRGKGAVERYLHSSSMHIEGG